MIQQPLKCITHPNRSVISVQIRQEYQQNRLMCLKCIQEQKIPIDDVMDILDFLGGPLNMLSISNRKHGVFDELKKFFDLTNRAPEIIIEEYRKRINDEIDSLYQKLSVKIQGYKEFENKIKQAKEQFCGAMGCPYFIDKLSQLQNRENFSQTKEWTELNKSLEDYIMQFYDQDNQELQSTLDNLKQLQYKGDYYFQELNDFKQENQKLMLEFEKELYLSTTDSLQNSRLLDSKFLISMASQWRFHYKSKLLFRGTEHGMNATSFWNQCNNQGPTLTICKSANGTVFGGYTPCKWQQTNNYQQDQSITSFLFNQNRKEVYPVFNYQYAIYGSSSYGPIFGCNSGYDLYISSDFKSGYSNLGYNYKVENQGQIQNFNQKTHLMGSAKPDLVEIEVYLLENIGI